MRIGKRVRGFRRDSCGLLELFFGSGRTHPKITSYVRSWICLFWWLWRLNGGMTWTLSSVFFSVSAVPLFRNAILPPRSSWGYQKRTLIWFNEIPTIPKPEASHSKRVASRFSSHRKCLQWIVSSSKPPIFQTIWQIIIHLSYHKWRLDPGAPL